MLLTSLNRMYRYLRTDNSTLSETERNNQLLLDWITAVSSRVEKHLNRTIKLDTYTEYFKTTYDRKKYFTTAFPISSITSVKSDSSGQFDGSESTLSSGDDYHVDSRSRAVVLDYPIRFVKDRGLQIVYTGGLASHSVKSTFAVSGVTGTWTVDKYAVGLSSGARGIVKTVEADSLTIENLYGIFESGETLNEYDDEDSVGDSEATAKISSITSQSLVEAYPDLVRAVEIEVRYMWKHRFDLENISTDAEGFTKRRESVSGKDTRYNLQPEVQSYLSSYKRLALF